jgi:hypothetical protein
MRIAWWRSMLRIAWSIAIPATVTFVYWAFPFPDEGEMEGESEEKETVSYTVTSQIAYYNNKITRF